MNGVFSRNEVKNGRSNEVIPVATFTQTERVALNTTTAGTASLVSASYINLNDAQKLRMTFEASGTGNLAGGETITLTLYRYNEVRQTYYTLGTLTCTVPAVTAGTSKVVDITDASNLVPQATHVKVTTGSVAVATGCTTVFGLEFTPAAASTGISMSSILSTISSAFATLTNSFQVSEVAPLDQRMTPGTLVIDTTTDITAGNTLCYPAAAATPTSCWDIGALNAGSGHAKMITLTGHIKTSALSGTAVLKIYGSNDPNATVASKRWSQVGFYENTSTIRNYVADITVTSTGSAVTYNYAIDLNEWGYRYMYIAFTANTLAIDEHSAYICASY